MRVAEQVRDGIAALRIRHVGSPCGVVTASLGVAAMHVGPDLDQASLLLSDADAALYAAKRGGRNRVQAAGRLEHELRTDRVL